MHHAFLYISLPSLDDYDVKMPSLTFLEDVNTKTKTFFFFSFTLMQSFRNQLQKKKMPTFDELNELE